MKIREIQKILNAQILCGESMIDNDVYSACCSDMMSDVLAYVKDQGVLITGLVNPQVIRTANMMDIVCVIFVRNKMPGEDILQLANECGIAVLASSLRAYEASGMLYNAGLVGKHGDSNV